MNKPILLLLSLLFLAGCNAETAVFNQNESKASWISVPSSDSKQVDEPNLWMTFTKTVNLDKVPTQAIARIGADSKYWLNINGQTAVFEGSLKRGPKPGAGYYDEIDVAQYLKEGENTIDILLWYFGIDGFSHLSSGKAGVIFSLENNGLEIASDSTWLCCIRPEYSTADNPKPNYRLSESNIRFDSRVQEPQMQNATEHGSWGAAPWGEMHPRPIPMWKDYGIKTGELIRRGDSTILQLPYNMQMTPIIKLHDNVGGSLVHIKTDHSFAGATDNIRAEYITSKGEQSYESLGWMNGQQIVIIAPSNVEIKEIHYRETGYATEREGRFCSSDPFFNLFWEKALRTLYVNMRDNFFDCPDRERAQWWGDVVVLMGECFYTYSTSTHALMKKAIYELCAHQNEDGVLHSPIPGNYSQELPGQMLASVGKYGFWNYYMNTGDIQTIRDVYPPVKKYLSIWDTDSTGLTAFREGGWTWGDWGDNKDIRLIIAGWHHLALEGAMLMAEQLGYTDDAVSYRELMDKVASGYNACWNGKEYRHPDYDGMTDDRVNALAVLTGIAGKDKYPQISQVLKDSEHASPYFEKYVMEALFRIGEGTYAMERTRKRFDAMVNHPEYTTLFEGWEIGSEKYGGGTTNHAWSGGTITVIASELCGIKPVEGGFKQFEVRPQPTDIQEVSLDFPTVNGKIGYAHIQNGSDIQFKVSVPKGTRCHFVYGDTDTWLRPGTHTLNLAKN